MVECHKLCFTIEVGITQRKQIPLLGLKPTTHTEQTLVFILMQLSRLLHYVLFLRDKEKIIIMVCYIAHHLIIQSQVSPVLVKPIWMIINQNIVPKNFEYKGAIGTYIHTPNKLHNSY
uniref:Uncharacterized protein n=1 Tax=Cacopsylla melanoneura TaxID=428564 RepID=A0A8D8V0V3_9HEMI